ncbi:Hypothetical protein, putative [Bodo saltans]|uniref:Uncharacterized protein n=1 Tax=Bodo saltans TaxID=75058 RepID=A0A0S4JAW8_BODSA|nr:Hypothetical protein, putative [Bodo saltans]|eukprot:CUG87499.1 Hypothetical protein, putative [Bodo saltans]
MQRKLITGALLLQPWPFWPTKSPYYLRREDAANLGVLPSDDVMTGSSGSSSLHSSSCRRYINAMATTNPLMFHDDFCAENEIPVLVGFGPLTGPNIREVSRKLCQKHGWSTKPARWLRMLDILDAGLLPAVLASTQLIDSHPDALLNPHLLEQIHSRVPLLDTRCVGYYDTDVKLSLTTHAFHVDYLCNNAENKLRGITQSIFHESWWPNMMVKLTYPHHKTAVSPAAGFTSAMYGHHLAAPPTSFEHWVNRWWLDAKFVPHRDPSRGGLFPVSFDTRMIHVDRELSHLTEAQRSILKTYAPTTLHGAGKPSSQILKQMLNCALEFPKVVSPYWGLSPPPTFKENLAVPAVIVDGKGGRSYAWRNFVQRDSSKEEVFDSRGAA